MTIPLIVMACSATKSKAGGSLQALERYDGPMWRTLRACLHETTVHPAIWFVSARYGFQPASLKIPDYEHRLTDPRDIPTNNRPNFARVCAAHGPILFAGGALYRAVMREAAAPRTLRITETDGLGIGYQRAQLGAWMARHCR